MREMTVTQGLCELKLYDNRITKAIEDAVLVGSAKISAKTVGTTDKEAFKNAAIASAQSIKDLIDNRARLKAAIVKSNAITKVKVGDEEMTVAEAIERKNSICYEKLFLNELKGQFANAQLTVTRENSEVNAQIDKLLETAYGKDDSKRTSEVFDSIAKPYHAANDWEIVDPIKVADVINELNRKIEDFETNVDTALSVVNATTIIQF